MSNAPTEFQILCENGAFDAAKNYYMNYQKSNKKRVSSRYVLCDSSRYVLCDSSRYVLCNPEQTFIRVCGNGHLEIAQWLLTLYPDMNISIESDLVFRYTCLRGQLHIAKWLLNNYYVD